MPFVHVNFEEVPILGGIIGWCRENDVDYAIHVTGICLFLLYIGFVTSPTLMGTSFSFFFALAPIWFPYIAFHVFHFRWMDYVFKKFYVKNGRTLYRLKLPQEVTKSPEAMEFVINQIYSKQEPDNYWQTYIDGKNPLPIGLEIVSLGGDVRFYVNVNTKKGVESFLPTIYSQYPGVEVIEEPVDYAAAVKVVDPEWDIWTTHLGKKEKKWGPIKTYIEFGLDKMPKEEEKVDPLIPMLELLGNVTPHERIYVQLILKAYRKPSFLKGQLVWGEGPNWTKAAEERVDEILKRDSVTKAPLTNEGSDFDGSPRISPGEREDVEAIERNIAKYGFNVGIRFIYMTKKGHFNPNMINAINRIFAQYDKVGRASIGVRWRTDFNYMWFSDPFGDRLRKLRAVEHYHYKLRKYNPHNQSDGPKVMTTEEIATMFHLPGQVALTPSLARIPSTKSQAPPNLPVGEFPSTS